MNYTLKLDHFSPDDIANSGQIFRMAQTGDAEWTLCAGSERLVITMEITMIAQLHAHIV